MFPQNSERVVAQKKTPIRVIIGNPPYSVGQKSANDFAQNQNYPKLDKRIADTYVASSITTMNKANYDAYVKAFRWSSDRIDENHGGIICFVSNGSWLEGNTTAGFRKCIEKEFSEVYVFNLRGNQRTSGELSRKEGGKIFGSGSRAPIAITLLVKKPNKKSSANIHYYDIGDYLSREEKLETIKKFVSVSSKDMSWHDLNPNEHGDWLNLRKENFSTLILIADKSSKEPSFFTINSNGVVTARDAWVYNFSLEKLRGQMANMIDFYNNQQQDYQAALKSNPELEIEDFISNDPKKIKWGQNVIRDAKKGVNHHFDGNCIRIGLYRPFHQQQLYFDRNFIWSGYLQPKIFPDSKSENMVICTTGVGASKGFSALMTDKTPNLDTLEKLQCFPLYYYEEREKQSPSLFDTTGESEYIRRDGISDFIYEQAKKLYSSRVTKEDIFYYVYGILHSPEYRKEFANDLKKMLPRLPLVDEPNVFWKLSKAGRELAELHVNYEGVEPCPVVKVEGAESKHYKVEKMRFPAKDKKDTIIFNSKITISNIPEEAYDYVVNGKSAIEWIMERYQVTVNKDSGIKNDPNDWAEEVGNPRYILDLLLSVINVSTKTVEIVKGLPKLTF